MSARDERRVAVEADVDTRTVRKVYEGGKLQSPALEVVVREAIRKLGFAGEDAQPTPREEPIR